jgi:hypothetical protein
MLLNIRMKMRANETRDSEKDEPRLFTYQKWDECAARFSI